jgi:hypothetical protein
VGEPPPRAVFGALAEDSPGMTLRETVEVSAASPDQNEILGEGAGAPLLSRESPRFSLK